eukprot:m.607939 g.607939  ORF g.607939 m.607939 type:complete len:84 (+) comp22482_c0_seq11:1945-2196(+)
MALSVALSVALSEALSVDVAPALGCSGRNGAVVVEGGVCAVEPLGSDAVEWLSLAAAAIMSLAGACIFGVSVQGVTWQSEASL